MIGWIIYNGQLQSEKIYELVIWLKDTAKAYDLNLVPVKNNQLLISYDNSCQPQVQHIKDLPLPDFVISWDKDIPLARHFEKLGIRVYNSAEGILACDDKIKTYDYLANHGIASPKTIIAPMVFSNCQITDHSLYQGIVDQLGLPLIIKEAFGSFGQQVYMVHSLEELVERVKTIGPRPHLFQEYIKASHGKDIRLNIVGDQVVTSMMRVSQEDFRANITNGGQAKAYQPSQEEIALALKCHQLLGLDFSGVDLLFSDQGPMVCEINGNPHFKSIYQCTGVDVSHHIIEYIIKDMSCKDI